MNAIFAASGDQAGSPSMLTSFVRFVSPVPSAFMTKTSESMGVLRVNAICVPSGDQAGVES